MRVGNKPPTLIVIPTTNEKEKDMAKYTEVRISIDPTYGYRVRATNKDTDEFYTTTPFGREGEVLSLEKAIRISHELMEL